MELIFYPVCRLAICNVTRVVVGGSSQSIGEPGGLVQSLGHQVDLLRQELTETQSQLQQVLKEAERYVPRMRNELTIFAAL